MNPWEKKSAELKAEVAADDAVMAEFKAEFMAHMAAGRLQQAEVLEWLHDAGDKYPEYASLVQTDDELEVDDKPLFSHAEEGCWVSSWSWVDAPDEEDEDEEDADEETGEEEELP